MYYQNIFTKDNSTPFTKQKLFWISEFEWIELDWLRVPVHLNSGEDAEGTDAK